MLTFLCRWNAWRQLADVWDSSGKIPIVLNKQTWRQLLWCVCVSNGSINIIFFLGRRYHNNNLTRAPPRDTQMDRWTDRDVWQLLCLEVNKGNWQLDREILHNPHAHRTHTQRESGRHATHRKYFTSSSIVL